VQASQKSPSAKLQTSVTLVNDCGRLTGNCQPRSRGTTLIIDPWHGDGLLFFRLMFRSRAALSAEVLFLRTQPALLSGEAGSSPPVVLSGTARSQRAPQTPSALPTPPHAQPCSWSLRPRMSAHWPVNRQEGKKKSSTRKTSALYKNYAELSCCLVQTPRSSAEALQTDTLTCPKKPLTISTVSSASEGPPVNAENGSVVLGGSACCSETCYSAGS
jgi:hypothetical protein